MYTAASVAYVWAGDPRKLNCLLVCFRTVWSMDALFKCLLMVLISDFVIVTCFQFKMRCFPLWNYSPILKVCFQLLETRFWLLETHYQLLETRFHFLNIFILFRNICNSNGNVSNSNGNISKSIGNKSRSDYVVRHSLIWPTASQAKNENQFFSQSLKKLISSSIFRCDHASL